MLDEQMPGAGFLAYVQQVLRPTLPRGDIMILENHLPAHKSATVREAAEATGTRLLLLPR